MTSRTFWLTFSSRYTRIPGFVKSQLTEFIIVANHLYLHKMTWHKEVIANFHENGFRVCFQENSTAIQRHASSLYLHVPTKTLASTLGLLYHLCRPLRVSSVPQKLLYWSWVYFTLLYSSLTLHFLCQDNQNAQAPKISWLSVFLNWYFSNPNCSMCSVVNSPI